MAIVTESVLLSSVSTRLSELEDVSNPDAESILSKVNALLFAAWTSGGVTVSSRVADFYKIGLDHLKDVVKKNRAELELNGMVVTRGKEIRDESGKFPTFIEMAGDVSRVSRLTLWSPRAVLCFGLLLSQSEVAKQLRTVFLDFVCSRKPEAFQLSQEMARVNAFTKELEWLKESNPALLAQLLMMQGCNSPSSQALELLDTYGLLSNRMGLAFNKQLKVVELCNDITGVEEMQKLKTAYVQQVRENTDLEGKIKKLKADLKKAEVVIETWKNRAEGLEMVIKRDNSSLGIVEPTPPTGRKPAVNRAIVTPPPSSDSSAYGSMLVPVNPTHYNNYDY